MRLSSQKSPYMRLYARGDIMELCDIQVRLRTAIKESGIPQKEIAKAIGVSAQTVSKYMKENIFPALDTLSKLCNFLDVSADYILGIETK